MIELNEIIESRSYVPLCDYQYAGQDNLPSGIIHCDMCAIPEFFRKIDGNHQNYIVVSSSNDFGLYYQKHFPVWMDAHKAVRTFARPEDHYYPIQMHPRCDIDKCNINDTFSIKCYMWTASTFDKIPENVKFWFMTNCGIIDNTKLMGIPFGVLDREKLYNTINQFKHIQRIKDLYVNFQWYTNERMDLYLYYLNHPKSNITVEKDIDYEQYIQQLLTHYYCLCPVSNGADGYRIWECLYAECKPITEHHHGISYLINIKNIHIVNSLYRLLDINFDISNNETKFIPTDAIKLSYWKRIIEEKRLLL